MGRSGEIFELSQEAFNKNLLDAKIYGHIGIYSDTKKYNELYKKYHNSILTVNKKSTLKGKYLSGEEYLKLRSKLIDKSYKLLGEFTTSSQCDAWEFFGEICKKEHPKIYKFYKLLMHRVLNGKIGEEEHYSGYLLSLEIKQFIEELDKIDIKELESEIIKAYTDLIKKNKSELLKIRYESSKDSFKGNFLNPYIKTEIETFSDEYSPILVLKKILEQAHKDKVILCMNMTG